VRVEEGSRLLNLREVATDGLTLARLTWDLPGFLRHPVSREGVHERVERRLATRQQRLLAGTERNVYRNPRSPYRTLLQHAGCELGRDDLVARYHAELWRQAGTIEIRREPPLTTGGERCYRSTSVSSPRAWVALRKRRGRAGIIRCCSAARPGLSRLDPPVAPTSTHGGTRSFRERFPP
jgi:hypothetical protein